MNEAIKKAILEKIKEYDKILIFRHFRPDGDAVGSTKGLAAMLKLTYPEKKIYLQNADFSDYLSFLGGEDEILPDEEYADALPTEVSFAVGLAAFLLFVVFMVMPMIASVSVHFKSFTVSLYAAVFMMVFFTAFCVPSVVYPVCNDTHNYSDYEQHCKQDHCLLWNHRKHDKRLVA